MAMRDGILAGYRGHVDVVEPVLSGWVGEIARPSAPVRCLLSVDRKRRVPVVADRLRADVAAAGLAGPNCGFSVGLAPDLLDGAEHEIALLLADGRHLNLPGMPASVALGAVQADLVAPEAASLDAVLDLLRRNDCEAGFDPNLVQRHHAAAFNRVAVPHQGAVFYARAGGRLVGYGRLDRGRGDAGGFGIVALTVLAAYRRKGLGEGLMRALLRTTAEADGVRQVWLAVRPDNVPALRLYEKLGFARDPGCPSGQWAAPGDLTMVWMAK
jgi:ribosomal protein S18 acetylase RimI-like enzyme